MELSIRDVKKITLKYNLGEVMECKTIDGGMINTNFLLQTKKGKFILRFLRKDANNKYIKERELEFKVIKFLKKNKYPYRIPMPITNKEGKIISTHKKRKYWIYNFIEGEKVRRLNNNQVKEVARAISKYHNIVSRMKGGKGKRISRIEWVVDKYSKMRNVDRRKKLNKIMLKRIDYFQKHLDGVVKVKFEGTILPVHADFHQSNIIFEENKVVGIIDFDNVEWSLKHKDIANSMKSVCRTKDKMDNKKISIYLREYRKHNKLTKKEMEMIKPLMIRNYCIIFWWAYEGGLKNEKKRPQMIEYAYHGLKSLERIKISL